MRHVTAFMTQSWICALFLGQALTSAPAAAQDRTCKPTAEQAAELFSAGARGPARPAPGPAAQPPIPRNVNITAIPGVVAAGGKWTKVWQEGGNSADGIIPDKDGNVLVAQEDYDTVLKINADGQTSVAVADAKGVGSLSMDRQGRLYGVHRTERPGSTKPDKASIVNSITELAPERMLIADKWADGTTLTVRPNDLATDSHGGAYFTTGCLYYASSKGVTVMADNIRTNGIAFSPDDKILYVTNGSALVAFDVEGPGLLSNRRDFAMLPAGNYGDGMAVDSKGRLYVSSGAGVQVFDNTGKYLGVIPTPRGIISVAFAGPNKKTLYVVGSGADDEKGQPIRQGPQQTAATVYRLPVIAQGLKGRAK
ncbi:MAG TPA: SMP-30/gluconolactonase/LRE family protein [Candidatus Acidoferrales bacterium]|nr:SMP-30/gluconolactonase/LRE family protein [Candidatus Acidoferrales bacterium]